MLMGLQFATRIFAIVLALVVPGAAIAQGTGVQSMPTAPSLTPALHFTPSAPIANAPVAAQAQAACTQEVAPVCGSVKGRSETFSNACLAQNAGASGVHDGACH
jgi:hypothetical protein